jgi:hypothetical protein
MDDLIYEKIGEVNGRWKADVIESFLTAEGIEVELIQGAITHYVYKGIFDLVEIYVPNTKVLTALELLKSFEEFQPEKDEDADEE